LHAQIGLDFSHPDTKLEWRDEVSETLKLVERFLIDATASLGRILEALQHYDEGKMTMLVKFSSSTETRTIEKALREPAHAVKGAAATVTFDRVALAFRAIELPLKDAAERAEAEGLSVEERRAFIDGTLGADRQIVRDAWKQLDLAVQFLHDEMLAHVSRAAPAPPRPWRLAVAVAQPPFPAPHTPAPPVVPRGSPSQLLEHRCGRRTVEEAQLYIPTMDELDDGVPMPEGEPEDYNQEDWSDDIADVSEDLDEILERVPRDLVSRELAAFAMAPLAE